MTRTFTYNINTHSYSNITILEYLKSLRYSQGLIAHLKRTPNGILKNGTWAYVRDQLSTGDILTINLVEQDSTEKILPLPLPLTIVYEDEDLMIVDKPANMPIHPSQGNYDNTLANAVAWYYHTQGIPFVYRCINRLDRDTTGLLILAKNAYSAALLSHMVGNRDIHRTYLAIATGHTPPSGTISAPIGRVKDSTIERCVDMKNGDYACTHYTTLNYSFSSHTTDADFSYLNENDANFSYLNENDTETQNGYSLVSLQLETGRTHQIRVHMKHIGHPLPGDFLYHPDYSIIQRQALHSHQLSFIHPITGENLTFTSPLPDDMKSIFTS